MDARSSYSTIALVQQHFCTLLRRTERYTAIQTAAVVHDNNCLHTNNKGSMGVQQHARWHGREHAESRQLDAVPRYYSEPVPLLPGSLRKRQQALRLAFSQCKTPLWVLHKYGLVFLSKRKQQPVDVNEDEDVLSPARRTAPMLTEPCPLLSVLRLLRLAINFSLALFYGLLLLLPFLPLLCRGNN